jgi:N utilization substance protein A
MEKEQVVTLIDAFKDFKEEKNIDRPVMMGVLKDVFLTQIAKTFGSSDNFDVIVNVDKGTCEIYQNFEIVEEVTDPNAEMTPEQVAALTGDDDYEVGDTYTKKFNLQDFGRRGILNIRQNLQGRIMELEKKNIYDKYVDRIGEIIVGEVYQAWKKEVLVMDEDGNELVLPKTEQIPSDFFRKGDTVKAVITSVEMRNGSPVITLSRTAGLFLERLFEQEVPEIYDGLITIKKVVRVPGDRAKVAVESYDDRIDPVGACVGVKGSRIHGIVRELRNENIDVINWSNNTQILIQRALSPAKISSIEFLDDEVRVYLKKEEISLAIGKGGSNIKLAGMLVGKQLEVYRADSEEEQDDVLLDDFNDEIEQWIIDALKGIGCDTAKSVLALPADEIAERADLEIETVEDVLKILRAEFE